MMGCVGAILITAASLSAAPTSHEITVNLLTDDPGPSCAAGSKVCTYRGALADAASYDDALPVHIHLPAGKLTITSGVRAR